MSELIAEARVLVTPDTTTFRTQLATQLAAIAASTPPVPIKVAVAPVGGDLAGSTALAGARKAASDAAKIEREELRKLADQRKASLAAEAAQARSLRGLSSGAASAGLSLVGLRGATLAATGPFLAGAAGAIALGKAIGIATSFNSEIAVLGATTGATGEQLEEAGQAAREFGRDITLPGVTAGDAAKTITEFAKAGLEMNDAIAATRGGLQLAQAAQLSYTDAVTLTANALNAFNLSGSQSVRVADTLANAANLAQGGIEDTALALRQAAGAAAVVGVSFEDTTALLTLLAKNGLTGSDAGTALRTAFLRLVNPSKQARAVLSELNVQLRDLQGNVRPEVFAEFAQAQRNLTQAQQQANAAIVFGQDAFRAFGFLGREGTEGLNQVQAGLKQTGTAARIAQARMVGLRGASENLQNQLSDLGLTVGGVASGPIALLVTGMASLVTETNKAASSIVNLGTAIGGALPKPAGSDTAFDIAKDVFGFTNVVTGVASPLANIKRISGLIRGGSDDAADEVRNGGVLLRDAIESESRETSRKAQEFGARVSDGFQAGFDEIAGTIAAASARARVAVNQSIKNLQGQGAGLDEAFNRVLARGGSPQQQIAELRRQAANRQAIIDKAGVDATDAQLVARRKARGELASINQQIVALEKGIAADRKAASDEADRIAEDAQRESDRRFLERQADARARQDRLIGLADESEGVRDDITRRQALRVLITQQIVRLRNAAVDEKTKQAALKALVAAKQATSDEINKLVRTQRALNSAEREAAAAEITENLALRTQIAEARGNESAVIRRIDAQISDAQKAIGRAKKGSQEWLKATLAYEELRKKRRELLKEVEGDEDRGTTAFDLLTQAAERFTGGNIIGAAQPFAGPTEFTADLSQFLRRNATTSTAPTAAKSPFAGFTGSADRLVEAINRNTAALNGGEGGPPVRKGKRPPVSKAVGNTFRGWWQFADEARDQVEGAG